MFQLLQPPVQMLRSIIVGSYQYFAWISVSFIIIFNTDEHLMDWRIVNFLYYSLAYLFYGSIITAMGPIIPFYSEETGKPEPYFSFVFFSRAVGYVLGGILVKMLMERFRLHHILQGSVFAGGVFFAISAMSITFWNLTIFLTLGACCCCCINISCNVCIMKMFRGEKEDFWIQMIHMVFGIGGLVGPFLVSFLGSISYIVLGVCLAVTSVLVFFLRPPDRAEENRVSTFAKPINRTSQAIICILYTLYIGQEVGYGSWVSSYAVMEKVATASQAAFASLVFWVTNTVFRILLLFVTIKISLRLKILLVGMICGCIVNMIAAMSGHAWFAAFIGSFLNGMFLASMFALFLALPLEFGYKLSRQNTANFMMCASLGEGVLGMPIGYAMGLFGPGALYWTELIFSIASYFFFTAILGIFERENKMEFLTPQEKEIEEGHPIVR